MCWARNGAAASLPAYKPDWKKAYVKLKAGEKLPEYVSNL
jgi:ribosomal protein L23